MNTNRISRVSRRDFLKLAGMGAAGLALSNYLAGCAPKGGGTLNVLVPAGRA